jgi:hypothetical protein
MARHTENIKTRQLCCSQSGSQILFPSSSKDANAACSEDAATINDVDGSKTTCAYALERGTDRDGRLVLS